MVYTPPPEYRIAEDLNYYESIIRKVNSPLERLSYFGRIIGDPIINGVIQQTISSGNQQDIERLEGIISTYLKNSFSHYGLPNLAKQNLESKLNEPSGFQAAKMTLAVLLPIIEEELGEQITDGDYIELSREVYRLTKAYRENTEMPEEIKEKYVRHFVEDSIRDRESRGELNEDNKDAIKRDLEELYRGVLSMKEAVRIMLEHTRRNLESYENKDSVKRAIENTIDKLNTINDQYKAAYLAAKIIKGVEDLYIKIKEGSEI